MTVKEALMRAKAALAAAGVPDAGAEAEYLAAGALGIKRHALFTDSARRLDGAERGRLAAFIKRRAAREPAQYILGETDFRGHVIRLTPDVLIPRPETELLVDEALRAAGGAHGLTVIDICTGSGCVAVSLAAELKNARVLAADVSAKAIAVAGENARINGVADRIGLFCGDLFAPLDGAGMGKAAAIITANPPYVPDADMDSLEPEVREHEPRLALSGGNDGLTFIRRIIDAAPEYLCPAGWLIMEFGWGQAEIVASLAARSGAYQAVEVVKDLCGIERILRARTHRT